MYTSLVPSSFLSLQYRKVGTLQATEAGHGQGIRLSTLSQSIVHTKNISERNGIRMYEVPLLRFPEDCTPAGTIITTNRVCTCSDQTVRSHKEIKAFESKHAALETMTTFTSNLVDIFCSQLHICSIVHSIPFHFPIIIIWVFCVQQTNEF